MTSLTTKPESHAPFIIAIVLLLLPVLYLGSYLAIVVPGGIETHRILAGGSVETIYYDEWYQIGGSWSERLYWPLEQLDRKLSFRAWKEERSYTTHPRQMRMR